MRFATALRSTPPLTPCVAAAALALAVGSLPALASGSGLRALRVDTLADLEGGTGGITVGVDGTVYSSEFGNWLGQVPEGEKRGGTRIWKVTPDGEVSVLYDGIWGASGSAIDPEGHFYQSNIGANRITKVTPDGEASTYSDQGLFNPVGIEIDPEGTLWVANCGSGAIQKIVPGGESTESTVFLRSELLKCPNGITRGPDGTLYVANFMDGNVVRVTPEGKADVLATLPGGNNGHLIYAHDALWVVARAAHQIYRVDPRSGDQVLVAGSGEQGGEDGAPLEASFSLPNDLGWSPDGSILYVNEVADEESDGQKLYPTRVRRIFFE
ncbi:MAG: hypothetical protein DWQ30_16540 [Acidobacteria bacterium]|nr:MAG: hypothetical protein DWQ30_16540 [Acidobacteriota bacterium]